MTPERRARIAASLSDRDRALVATLRELRLATGDQLAGRHFAGISARERRRVLTRLVSLRVLARLPRPVAVSALARSATSTRWMLLASG